MGSLGEVLRSARLARGISLMDVEAATKIRQRYLAALESDQLDQLPHPVYARNFVRTYARFVGLDLAEVISMYDGVSPPTDPIGVQPEVISHRVPGVVTGRTIALIVLALFLSVGAFYLYHQYELGADTVKQLREARQQPLALMAPTAQANGTSATAPAPSAPARSPSPTSSPTPTPVQGVHVEVHIKALSWLSIVVDGKPVYQDNAKAGSVFNWDGNDKITMRTGNAGGTEVIFNGRSEGTLGAPGEVKDVQWTAAR